MPSADSIEIRLVTGHHDLFQDVLHFRQRVMKPDFTLEECINPGDLQPTTFHLAAYKTENLVGIAAGQLIGIASFEFEKHPELGGQKVFRLRGMASELTLRRQGIGRKLVEHGEHLIREQKGDLLWFNARIAAYPFYQSLGFVFHGPEFTIPRIGPHKLMYKVL